MEIIVSKKTRSTGMASAHGSEFKGDLARKKYEENLEKIDMGEQLTEYVGERHGRKIYKVKNNG